MRLILLGVAACALLCAQQKDTFEVKELPQATVKAIADSEAALASAVKALEEAQRVAEKAKQSRDSILAGIGSPQVGDCAYPKTDDQGIVGLAVVRYSTRRVRAVEIRGRYALITEKTESCSAYPSLTWVK